MTLHLIDSDGVIDQLKGFAPTIALIEQTFAQGHNLATCDVVLAEVFAGIRSPDVPAAERLLSRLSFLPTTAEAARQAGEWRYQYARRGIALSITDCLVAAVAQAHDALIMTRNIRHFPMTGTAIVALPRPSRP